MNTLMIELDSEEALGALSVLTVLLGKTDPSLGLAQDLATTIANTGSDTDRKISFIALLFNSTQHISTKCFLLTTLLDLASTASAHYFSTDETLGRIIYPANNNDHSTEPQLFQMIQNWSVQQRCQVYDAVCRALALPSSEDEDRRVTCRQRYLLKYNVDDPSNADIAKQTAIGGIRDPISLFQLQRNLLATVQILSKTEPKLYELLKIVQHGDLSEYKTFLQTNGKILTEYNLDAASCETNMRILTVCSLTNQHEADIPYNEIATAIQQDISYVESTVIQAIASGLLSAKMDQLNQTVMVERSVVRQFDTAQWKKLHARLTAWKTNVGGILDTLKQQQRLNETTASAGQ